MSHDNPDSRLVSVYYGLGVSMRGCLVFSVSTKLQGVFSISCSVQERGGPHFEENWNLFNKLKPFKVVEYFKILMSLVDVHFIKIFLNGIIST